MSAAAFRSGKPLKATREAWDAFWRDELAGLVKPGMRSSLLRLFVLYDERDRAFRGYMNRRLVEGSQGQPVLNPLFTAAKDMSGEIRALEDRFGLTPMALMRLGISVGQAERSLADLNEELNADPDEDAAANEAEDPRLSGTVVDVPGKKL